MCFTGHGLVTSVVFLDLLFFSPVPKMKRQFVFPVLFAAAWLGFSVAYYFVGGKGLKAHDAENGVGNPYLYKV